MRTLVVGDIVHHFVNGIPDDSLYQVVKIYNKGTYQIRRIKDVGIGCPLLIEDITIDALTLQKSVL